jgi:hypothetical protein
MSSTTLTYCKGGSDMRVKGKSYKSHFRVKRVGVFNQAWSFRAWVVIQSIRLPVR